MKEPDQLYRAVDTWYSVSDEWGEHSHSGLEVKIRKYPVIRRTPKGAWIAEFMTAPRFVLLSARKKFACETETEAWESLIARRERQKKIYLARADRAQLTIDAANSQLGRYQPLIK